MEGKDVKVRLDQSNGFKVLIESDENQLVNQEGFTDFVLFGLRGAKPEGFFVYRHSNSAFLNGGVTGMLAELCFNANKRPDELYEGFLTLDQYRDRMPNISYLALSQMEPMDENQVFSAYIADAREALLEFDDLTMYIFMGTGPGGPVSSFHCDGAFLMGAVAEGADQLAKAGNLSYKEAIGSLCNGAAACMEE